MTMLKKIALGVALAIGATGAGVGVSQADPAGAAVRAQGPWDRPGSYHPGLGWDNDGVYGKAYTIETQLIKARNAGESSNVKDLEVYTKNNKSIINYLNGYPELAGAWGSVSSRVYAGNVWEGSRHGSQRAIESLRFTSAGGAPQTSSPNRVLLKMEVWEGDSMNGDDFLGRINQEIPVDGTWRTVTTTGGEGSDYAQFRVRVR